MRVKSIEFALTIFFLSALGFLVFILSFNRSSYTAAKKDPRYISLQKPIYLVADPSFWTVCAKHPALAKTCRSVVTQIVRDGINSWLKHFNADKRPELVIVDSSKDVPALANTPIHLRIIKNGCVLEDGAHPACYRTDMDVLQAIVFSEPNSISTRLVTHEFGHALGRIYTHNDMPKGKYSVMSYNLPSGYVLPLDIQIMCATHTECPPHEDTWCEGGFFDKCRCPSTSYEEGETLRQLGKTSCR